jgi:hypothetical protein
MLKTIQVGGVTKRELLAAFERNEIKLNDAARTLFAHDGFCTSETAYSVEIFELTAAELGHADGATIDRIFESAGEIGLTTCPLELAPHLRLQFLNQAEGSVAQPATRHQAPPGSITVASKPLTEDVDVPRGFYLRRIEGALWLRGYFSGKEHVWRPEDHFVFLRR